MVKLMEQGAYLVNGKDLLVNDAELMHTVQQRYPQLAGRFTPAAVENTMAYGILKAHNISSNMETLQIKLPMWALSRRHVRVGWKNSRSLMF